MALGAAAAAEEMEEMTDAMMAEKRKVETGKNAGARTLRKRMRRGSFQQYVQALSLGLTRLLAILGQLLDFVREMSVIG